MKLKEKNSFTLIELLVVISIIAILSSAIFVYIKSPKEDAKLAKVLQFSDSINGALGDGIVGFWRFNEGSGNIANDASGYNNNCALTGSGINWTVLFSKLEKALNFPNQSGVYLNCGSNKILDINDDITLEAWIKPSVVANRGIIGRNTGDYREHYGLYLRSNREFGFVVNSDNNYKYVLFGSYSANQWYHIVGTYNKENESIKVFVNGTELPYTINSGSRTHQFSSVNIGRHGSSYSYFGGIIDEVKIYNTALDIAEIQKNYAQGFRRIKLAYK